MKKYLKILPLILFPYAYLIFLFFVSSIGKLIKEGTTVEVEIFSKLGLIAVVLYNLWVLILSLWSAIGGLKRYTPAEAVKMNLAVKGWQIPAYLFHFLLGAFGTLASVWGIGFVAFAIIIDLVTIFLSGLFAVGCVRRLKKEGVLSSETAFLAGLGSFIYCVDVIAAIALVRLCKEKFPQEESKLLHGTERSVRIRKTLAYLSVLLMALYPYAHMYRFLDNDPSVFVFGTVIYTLLVLFIAIRSAYDAFSLHSPFAAAGMNLAVKGLQVPAYMINFFSGALMGAVMSVWGLVPIVFFVIVDVIMIALSGIYASGCIRRLKKEGILSSGTAVLAEIGSFIFVIDVIVAIVLAILCYAKRPKKLTSPRDSSRAVRALAYLSAIALIFYPYAYRSPLLLYVSDFSLLLIVAFLYTVLAFIIAIRNAVNAFSMHSPRTAAGLNLAVKGLQIPAYFFNTTLGILAASADALGLVFTVPLFLVNGITSLISSIYAIGCVRRLKKEGILSSGAAILAGISSFIFGVDVIVAIVLVCVSRKKGAKTEQNETIASPQQTTVTMLPPPQAPTSASEETQGETASTNDVNVPPQEQQTAAENPLPPPLPPAPQKPAPAPETQGETMSTNAPQPKKRRKASEMPLPPPLPPAPQKPAPAQNEKADETTGEE